MVNHGADMHSTAKHKPRGKAAPLNTKPVRTFDMLDDATTHSILSWLTDAGPSIWALTALSIIMVALVLWKVSQLLGLGAWSGSRVTSAALTQMETGRADAAIEALKNRKTLRAVIIHYAMVTRLNSALTESAAREETERFAASYLERTRAGLRPLELIATIAPLLGLLGTVLGMIDAFQSLQAAGSSADPSDLAGGIWEALLTTAFGMAIAIPASIALTWFEGVADRIRHEIEDGATRVFVHAAKSDR